MRLDPSTRGSSQIGSQVTLKEVASAHYHSGGSVDCLADRGASQKLSTATDLSCFPRCATATTLSICLNHDLPSGEHLNSTRPTDPATEFLSGAQRYTAVLYNLGPTGGHLRRRRCSRSMKCTPAGDKTGCSELRLSPIALTISPSKRARQRFRLWRRLKRGRVT